MIRTIVEKIFPFFFGEPDSDTDDIGWVTVKTTSIRWEADLMQQILDAHAIPARIVDLGVEAYMGQGSPAALQVHVPDQQTALLLLSPIDEDASASG